MQQEDQTLSQENIDAVLKYLDMSPRDALKVEAAKIMRAQRKSEEEIRNAALEESALECEKVDTDYHPHSTDPHACWTNRGSGCAGAIRALKTTAPSQGEGS